MSKEKTYRQGGATGAILDEYEKAIEELKECIKDITEADLAYIVDSTTQDPNCKSVQTVLAHVVRAGKNYATQIHNHYGNNLPIPSVQILPSVQEYNRALDEMFRFTVSVLTPIHEYDLIEHDQDKKIHVTWGQYYDVEQLMEHAIVHVLRHRRQIEKFKIALQRP